MLAAQNKKAVTGKSTDRGCRQKGAAASSERLAAKMRGPGKTGGNTSLSFTPNKNQ